jgi:hypothetical protein
MKAEHKQFYEDVISALQSGSMAVFAGAGLSKAAGFVDWKDLLRGIATDLGLDVDRETDLISLAQYNVNKMSGRSVINQRIISEFNEEVELTENHRILARLPINTYWTTNYDDLIERSLKESKRIADVKHDIEQLNFTKPRRHAVVYKMHGDSTMPNKAVITKDDYEAYFIDKVPFVNTLSGDLQSKLFLFIGFSFTDPNLDYILSRVRLQMRTAQRHHWYFVKRVAIGDYGVNTNEDLIYNTAKQEHFISDLKRFKLQPVYVENYPEITSILKEIEGTFKKQTIFISGSAEEYGSWNSADAHGFIHKLSARIIREGYRAINGFGWGVGSAVINGALEEIYKRPEKYNEDQLMIKPFPQFATGGKDLPTLWNEYRREMLKYAGIAIYLFGNKVNPDAPVRTVINAPGVKKEYDIAQEYGVKHIPIKSTGYMSEALFTEMEQNDFFAVKGSPLFKLYQQLGAEKDADNSIEIIIKIIREINK